MDPLPTLTTILDQSPVSPPPATTTTNSLPLTFFDILWLVKPIGPVNTLFFYNLPITKTHFIQTIVPSLKHSLSITLQHFLPFAGKLTISPTRKPEIRYVEGDSVSVTFAECCALDFNHLTGNHPRECDKFYPLIPVLGRSVKASDRITIPVFAVQVTLFPNHGISIGLTNHHSLCDANTRYQFLNAWTSVARFGSDEPFLANGSTNGSTIPIFDRSLVMAKNPKLDETYLNQVKFEAFNQDYKLPTLLTPSGKVRATFILTRTAIAGLKKLVSTQLPSLSYASSFTVACAYIWNCVATLHNDEIAQFSIPVDCRLRMDPLISKAYFGNCIMLCRTVARTTVLKGKEGFLMAAKLIGENLYKMLTDKDGVVNVRSEGLLLPTTMIGVTGTPKLKFYDLDFGFGKPVKHEAIIDYHSCVSISAGRDCREDLEIGVWFSAAEMNVFADSFNIGLESYI